MSRFFHFLLILILGGLIVVGLVAAGASIGQGLYNIKMGDRYVSVKGISEQTIKSDVAIWDLSYKVAGNDLSQLSTQSESDQAKVVAFLQKNGFTNDEITIRQTNVVDQFAKDYQSTKPEQRYIISGGVTVKTNKVDLTNQMARKTSELIKDGVVLAGQDTYTPNPRYLITQLDAIRPKMLAEATRSARAAAEQFAIDSQAKIGSIRKASQGVFQIFSADSDSNVGYQPGMDQSGSIEKKIRVVTSIDFFLAK
jgi:hypothetical protein